MSDPNREYPSWPDVKKILDNPDVPEEHKHELVRSLTGEKTLYEGLERSRADENGSDDPGAAPDKFDQELQQYQQKFHTDYDKTYEATDAKDIRDVYDSAKKAGDDAGRYDKAVQDGKGALEDITRKAANGGAGCANSNEILDQGKPALTYFDHFAPLYQKVTGNMRKNPPNGDFTRKGVEKRYDEQRDINFANFKADADELRQSATTQREQTSKMAERMKSVWGGWSGSASQASQQKFAKINMGASTVGDYLGDTAQVIDDATHHVSKTCVDKVSHLLDAIKDVDNVAGRTSDQIGKIIDAANGNADDETLKQVCAYFGIEIDDGCTEDEKFKGQVQAKAAQWVEASFSPAFEGTYDAVIKICDQAKEAVNNHWKTLTDHLAKVEQDPFKNPGAQQDYHPDKGGQPNQSGSQPDQSGSGPSSAGGPSGGSPATASPAAAGAAGAAGAAQGGGGAPGAGGPATPSAPEAPPMPQRPGMPQPAPGPGTPGEKVTLGQGKGAVTLREPGADGKTPVQLTGTGGQPKTYAVDFAPASPAGGQPAQAPGQPVPVQAGPDGKAVIHEGDRTITLEQGRDGAVQVNVDNGDGKPPLNQTVDFGGEPKPPAGSTPAEPTPPPAAQPPPPPPAVPQPPTAMPVAEPAAAMSAAQAPSVDLGAASAAPAMPSGPAPEVPGAPAPTSPQSSGMNTFTTSGGAAPNSFGSLAGDLFDDGQQQPPQPGGHSGATGLSSLGHDGAQPHSAGSTGLSSLGGESSGGAAQNQAQGQSAMGGPMMGGMMPPGGGGQQGGEPERTNDSPWRTQGQLFDDGVEASNVRFRSVLGEDQDQG